MIASSRLLLTTLLLLLGAACATTRGGEASVSPDDLVGEWVIECVEDSPVLANSAPSIAFDEAGGVSGNGSLNRFSGQWSWAEAGLDLSPLAATKMAGPPALMEQEQRLFSALERVSGVSVEDGGSLLLRDGDGQVLLRARQAETSTEQP